MSAVEIHLPIVKSLHLASEENTRMLAQTLAAQPELRNAYLELRGDLGTGKTTLVRRLLHALGVQGRIKSPTYAVVEPYTLPDLAVWHFDFYRFNDPQEWEDAGFRDLFASPGLKLAEWPDKAAGLLPPADLGLSLSVRPDESRDLTLTANTSVGSRLLKSLEP